MQRRVAQHRKPGEEHRMAVGGGARDDLRAEHGVRSRAVLDDDALTERFAERARHRART
jgi:hypothetical protein